MMKSSTSFRFSSSLLFFFVASTAVYSQIPDDCLYRLAVKTGTVAEAGTDSIIRVKLSDVLGASVEIPDLRKLGDMSPGHEYFQKGNLDFFELTTTCLIEPTVSSITVTSDGSGQKPKWYLEYVKAIVVSIDVSETEFQFNQWLAIDEPPYELEATRTVSINDF